MRLPWFGRMFGWARDSAGCTFCLGQLWRVVMVDNYTAAKEMLWQEQ
jgi:hypothetical protein